MTIRTRFAPSPTGYLHVGGLRTALFSYLYARKHHGQFLLRIEDTDQKRFVEGAQESLISTLKWCGLDYDEGPEINGPHAPYIQSQRSKLYRDAVEKLIEQGAAYYCFCTQEQLEEMRKKQEQRHEAPMYDRTCLQLSKKEITDRLAQNTAYVIRQRIPEGFIVVNDLIRGKVRFDSRTIDDQVLMKSDGLPTYHLANVVDDHDMQITHVIRGEEWLPSTPKHIWLYQAFGWEPPEFAHIPLLLNADRTKLSKRQNDVSVEDYIKKGYRKEAIINFVAFLGWHPGKGIEKEIYSMDELIEAFTLEGVHSAGAIFNIEKLDWYNWQWHRRIVREQMDGDPDHALDYLLKWCETWCADLNPAFKAQPDLLKRALKTIEEKMFQEPERINEFIGFYFTAPPFKPELVYSEKMKVDEATLKRTLPEVIKTLETLDEKNFTEEKLKETLIALIASLGLKNGQVLWPLRAILTGEQFSPGAFEVMTALGKKETLKRLAI